MRYQRELGVWLVGLAMLAGSAAAAPQQVLIVVDESVRPAIADGLDTYMQHVQALLPVEFKVLSDDFYAQEPAAIRALLQREVARDGANVVGAIMVGPLPHAVRGEPRPYSRYYLTPAPLFYEDFESQWFDDNRDGYFERMETDRLNNPTEIWTAWWVPPANTRTLQTELLRGYLDKLDRYYRGEIVGRDGMIFIAGNSNSVEITESWTVLMNDAMRSTDQQVAKVYSRHGQMPAAVLPDPGPEFTPDDLEQALERGRYQHVHLLTHGSPDGFYWEQAAVRGTRLNFKRFNDTGANIITTSGCSNGNFRGRNHGTADYAYSIGNALVFSPQTITVAYYGATSPQSTGVFAVEHTPLFEGLDPQDGGYFGAGYHALRNTDVCWGTNHYVFRGMDGKALFGDPFARYRQPGTATPPPTAARQPLDAAAPAAETCR